MSQGKDPAALQPGVEHPADASPARQLAALVRAMRPRQWVKNGFILVPLVFDIKLTSVPHVLAVVAGVLLFSLMASAVYLINDLADIEADRAHPVKRLRPLPSGSLGRPLAVGAAVLFPLVALTLGAALNLWFAIILAAYLLLQLAYSYGLKHVVLLDAMAIAAGFLLRVAAGYVLADATRFSPWLFMFTAMLALFLAFAKRRQELVLLNSGANNHRAILDQYTIRLLDEIILIVTAMTIVTYALYTFSAENLPPNHTMMLTTPFVLYGIFRYLYLIHVRGEGGAPEEVVFRDRPLQLAILLWGASVILALYIFA